MDKYIRVRDGLSCPCCGAPIAGDTCEYCGRVLVDFACLETDKPFYLKVKKGDLIRIYRVKLTDLYEQASENCLWADNVPYYTVRESNLHAVFQVLALEE